MIFQQKSKIIKTFSHLISVSFSNVANKGVFPDELKHANIKPIYANILPKLTKIFERRMHDKLCLL